MAPSSVRNYYYSYPPYLQPMPSLSGTTPRINGSASVSSRVKFGSINRIYGFAKAHGQGNQFLNQLVFAIYGLQTIY